MTESKLKDYDLNEQMTVKELLHKLKITKRQLYDLVQRHKIPHRRVGRLLRFDPQEIDQWTKEQAAL